MRRPNSIPVDPAVERILARCRFALAIGCLALIAGCIFTHAIGTAFAPLLGVLTGLAR